MDRIETAVNSLAGKDAEKAYGDIAFACNTYSLNKKAFVEQITAQKPKIRKVWTDICWYWLKHLSYAYLNDNYDDRNKQACRIGFNLYQNSIYKFEPLPDLLSVNFVKIFITGISHIHPTTQQSFSSLVFAWLNYLANEKGEPIAKKAIKELIKTRGEHWYNMSMI